MTSFTVDQEFPATLDRLWTTFGDARYPRGKYRALGAAAVRVERFEASPEAIDVVLERDMAIDARRLPAWARPFAPATLTLRQSSRWRRVGPDEAITTIEVSPLGLPLHARGRGMLTKSGAGSTRLHLTWQVDAASLPLVGRSLERPFAHEPGTALEADHPYTMAALRRAEAGTARETGRRRRPPTRDWRGSPRPGRSPCALRAVAGKC